MTTIRWTAEASGDWRARADWSTGTLPGSGDDVILATAGAYTVTHSLGVDTVHSIAARTDRLWVSGGWLRVTGTADLRAGLLLSGGTLVLAGGGGIAGGLAGTGGTLALAGGTVARVTGVASLADGVSLTGLGTLDTGGATAIGADGSALLLGGGVTWSNAGSATLVGSVRSATAAHIVNLAGARFALSDDAAGLIASGSRASFVNAGTLAKTGGAGTSEIDFTVASTGSIWVAIGTLLLTRGGTLGGALGGLGTLELAGGSATRLADLDGSGLLLSTGTLTLADAAVTLGVALVQQGGTLGLGSGAALTVNASLSLRGGAIVNGLSTLATAGASSIAADGAAVSLRGGLRWSNAGTATLGGSVRTLNATSFDNAAGAAFVLAADAAGIIADGGRSSFVNAGLLAKSGGTQTSEIDSALTSTGTISVAAGTLDLTGDAIIGGTISGAGALLFGGGEVAIAAGTTVRVATLAMSGGSLAVGASLTSSLLLSGGELDLSGTGRDVAAMLSLSAATLTLAAGVSLSVLDAASLSGAGSILGTGTLATAGATAIDGRAAGLLLGSGLTWTNSGTVTAFGAIQSGASIDNAAGAAFDLAGDAAGLFGAAGTLVNAGQFAKLGGVGTSPLGSALTSTGTLDIASGTLALTGGGSIGGEVRGAGVLLFAGGSFAVAGSTAFSVANLAIAAGAVTLGDTATPADFAVAGAFALTGGSLMLAMGGVLTLDAVATLGGAGSIGGSATLATRGAVGVGADGSTTMLSAGLQWSNGGTVTDTGLIETAGVAAIVIDNAAGGVFDLAGDGAGIVDAGSVSTFVNAGTVAKTAGGGASRLYSSLGNTGTLLAASGTLALEFSAGLAGAVGGAGGGLLLLVNGATSAGRLAVTDNGAATSVQMASGYVSWSNTGSVAESGRVLLGDGSNSGPAILYNAPGAAWDLIGPDAAIAADGQAWFTNAGTIGGIGGLGSAAVAFDFTNNGLIDAASGTLALQGMVAGTGSLRIEAAGTLELGQALGAGQTLAFAGAGATLKLDRPASIAGPMQGFGVGDGIDFAAALVTAARVAGDVLSVTAGGSLYTFGSSQSLAGMQTHVADDGRGGSLVTLAAAVAALPATTQFAAFNSISPPDH